jgi:hypothetical protein
MIRCALELLQAARRRLIRVRAERLSISPLAVRYGAVPGLPKVELEVDVAGGGNRLGLHL